MSVIAAEIPTTVLLLLGASEIYNTASAKIICASGNPTISAACAADTATRRAAGSANPTSSAAQIIILREIKEVFSPPAIILAR